MYSQNSEESFILDYFKGTIGKFIDIGAYDVFKFSNTRALYELGWHGILVEPAPKNYKGIADHYRDDDRVLVFNVAIGADSGEVDFYESEDAVSTTNKEHMEKWAAAGVKFELIKVPQISVYRFMKDYGNDVDFLSIDTESTNINVFRSIPDFVFERVKMICIEHDGHQREIETKLINYGFRTVHANAENIILAK